MSKLHRDSLGPWHNHHSPLLFHGFKVTPEFDRVIEGCRYRPELTNFGVETNPLIVKTELGATGLREPIMIKSAPCC